MGIPLVRNNSVDDINTSIIAIKKELGKGGSGDMGDVNVNVDVKYEVTDTVEDGNSLPVTSQGVYDYVKGQGFTPVDKVAINNMKAVTSNAVAKSLSYSTTEQKTGGKWIDGKDIYRRTFTTISQGSAGAWSWCGLQSVVQSISILDIVKASVVDSYHTYRPLRASPTDGFWIDGVNLVVGSMITLEYTKNE